jgi:glycosyltransferase involved in cell wall biosynthesis
MPAKKAIIVLGMHRSGTSVLTRIVNLLGASLATDLMPPTEENPSGYWESIKIAKFNNMLLQSAGVSWKSDEPISPAWFSHPDRKNDYAEAKKIILSEFGETELFVLKCPRLSLLLPFWKTVFTELAIDVFVVMVLRDPLHVAKSLFARTSFPGMKPASIFNINTAALLWLRYVLDAERHSRELPRVIVDYSSLISNWQSAIKPILDGFFPSFPGVAPIPIEQINHLLDPSMRRRKPEAEKEAADSPWIQLLRPLNSLKDSIIQNNPTDWCYFDTVFTEFERMRSSYEPLRFNRFTGNDTDIWATEILKNLKFVDDIAINCPKQLPTILFISAVPAANIGQVFRVKHVAEALEAFGWETHFLHPKDADIEQILQKCDMVVAFRTEWDETLETISKTCHIRKIPLVYDVDDILFQPDSMTPELFPFLTRLPESGRNNWIEKANRHQLTLLNADAAILTTKPLAKAAARYIKQTFVLPNTLNNEMLATADKAEKQAKPSANDGILRIGFVAGTETHQQNFGSIEKALSKVLAINPMVHLVLIGPMEILSDSSLAPFQNQIETRPKVALNELFSEIYRLDINLAPLEVGNPFCETKSELRYLFAAAVSVPTIGSATVPLKEAILDNFSGFIASNTEEWIEKINLLIEKEAVRIKTGQTAKIHALAQFGPEALHFKALQVYSKILMESNELP